MNKTLNDPEELERIKQMYETPRFMSDEPNEVLKEREVKKQRLTTNQAK